MIRPATPADAPALAQLHVRVWRETYAALAPAEALTALDEARRLTQWQATLARPAPHAAWLAEGAPGAPLVGLVSAGPPSHPAFGGAGEIAHLYVASGARGAGLGRALLGVAIRHLLGAGFAGAALAVVAGNAPARAFYARMGGRDGGRFTDPGPLWRSDNRVIRWDAPP